MPEDEDHTIFPRLGGSDEDGDDDRDGPVLSRAAFMLHSQGMVNSVREGSPRFISDDYLNAISGETAVTAAELCMVGLWERDDVRGCYVIHDPMVEEVVEFNRRMADDAAFCEATGGHERSDETGPNRCAKCWASLGETITSSGASRPMTRQYSVG